MARQRVLGLPIGKERRSKAQVAKTAGAAAAMLAAPVVAVPVARKAGQAAHKAGNLIGKGKKVAGQASEVMDTATDVKQAMSSHSSTLGKIGGVISAAKGGERRRQQAEALAPDRTAHRHRRSPVRGLQPVDPAGDVRRPSPRASRASSRRATRSPSGPARSGRRGAPGRGPWLSRSPTSGSRGRAEGGAQLQGVVTFHSFDVDLTRVLLQMEYKPKGAFEWVGNTLRIQRRRATARPSAVQALSGAPR